MNKFESAAILIEITVMAEMTIDRMKKVSNSWFWKRSKAQNLVPLVKELVDKIERVKNDKDFVEHIESGNIIRMIALQNGLKDFLKTVEEVCN